MLTAIALYLVLWVLVILFAVGLVYTLLTLIDYLDR